MTAADDNVPVVPPTAGSAPPPATRRRLVGVFIAGAVLGLISAVIRYGPSTAPGRALVAGLVSGVRVGDLGWLSIEGLDGDPWSDFTLRRLTIADRQGVWLDARRLAVRWRAQELWRRRVHIEALSARSVTLMRRPATLPSEAGGGGGSPVAVRIDRIATMVTMTPQFAWRRGDYLLDGALDLGRNTAASGRVSAVSLLHPGDFLRVGFKFSAAAIGLEAHAREAMGGALAGSLGLEADKPFFLDARAHGTPRAGWFDLATAVGPTAAASAAGRWSPVGGQASGRLDMTASKLLAPWRAGVGPLATFRLDASRLAESRYRVALQASAEKAAVRADGEIDPGRLRTGVGGLLVSAQVADLSAIAGVPGLGPTRASGRLTGDARRWKLIGTASADKVEEVGVTLTRLAGPFQLEQTDKALTLKIDAVGAGGAGAGPVAVLLGPSPRAAGEIDWLAGGRILLRKLAVHGLALDVEGDGAWGLFGDLSFRGKARAHNLAAAAPGTAGTIQVDWRAAQPKATAPWTFSLQARGQGLRLASAEANSLLGPAPAFRADGRYDSTALTIDRASLDGGGVAGATSGSMAAAGDLRFKVAWTGKGPLLLGPLAISGRTQGEGTVSGTLTRPRLDLMAGFASIDLPDLADLQLRDARLALTLMRDEQTLSGRVGLAAASDQGPARVGAAFALVPGGVSLSDIDVAAAGVALSGSATLKGRSPIQADLAMAVGPGVLLTSGRADGRIQVTPAADGPHARVSLKGAALVFPDNAGALETLSFTADGPMSRLPYQIEARGDASGLRGRLKGAGVLTHAGGEPAATFTGAGRLGAADLRTLAPAELAFRRSGVAGSLHLAVGQGGRADVTLNQTAAGLNGRAVLAALDLALIDPDVRGRADGVLAFSRVANVLAGTAQLTVAGLTSRDLEGSTPLAGSLNATFGGDAVSVSTQLTDTAGSRLSVDLRLPATLSASPLVLGLETRKPISGHFSADGAVGPVWDLLEGGGQSLTGRLVASGTIGGTLADPRLTGTASLDGGDFEDAVVGLKLKGVTVRAAMQGDSVNVTQFAATDGAKGALDGSGRLSLVRDGDSSFRLGLRGFRVIDNAQGVATASGVVNVDRAGDGRVRLGGALVIDHAQISPTPPNPSGVVPMEVTEIHQTGDADALLAPPAARQAPVALDISLKAPGGVFIKGRGLNLELSLDARVSGTTSAPALTGVARVVRGDYDFAGKRFQVDDRSTVHLGSSPETIRLDLTATRDDPTLTAVIRIGGTAAAPTLTLSSTPVLPKDEVLSQVLFGSSAAQLSGLQAAQLASALAGLAGGGGFDVIGGLRNFAHLDRLAIDSSAAAGFAVAGGKYITDKLYVEVSGGRTGQGAQVEWRVRKHLAIVSRVTSQGDHAVSIRWRKDY